MSVPRHNYDPRRVCINPFPNITLGKHRRTIGIYLAGGLFALANWTFLDAAILSAHAHAPYDEPERPPPVHVTFVDWLPGIFSLIGMLIINLIDKDRVQGHEDFGDARATVLVLKYILQHYAEQYTYYGYANVSQNVALMLSAIVLWVSQSVSTEYEYTLSI
ncbi:hypothetical protein ONZ51_g10301 [Trametes cubensis]|uniref:Uncharacterized protein n=1 Tax=Trametes cubensis TaxID=1111947 RepID=A0AAD7X6J0_9APHY|nr:hypothetical protein ONZ51_g10301 [Trametes cubensis]